MVTTTRSTGRPKLGCGYIIIGLVEDLRSIACRSSYKLCRREGVLVGLLQPLLEPSFFSYLISWKLDSPMKWPQLGRDSVDTDLFWLVTFCSLDVKADVTFVGSSGAQWKGTVYTVQFKPNLLQRAFDTGATPKLSIDVSEMHSKMKPSTSDGHGNLCGWEEGRSTNSIQQVP